MLKNKSLYYLINFSFRFIMERNNNLSPTVTSKNILVHKMRKYHVDNKKIHLYDVTK